MASTETLFDQALLADAAYVNLNLGSTELTGLPPDKRPAGQIGCCVGDLFGVALHRRGFLQ
jgi:hypothetical protein